MLIKYNYSILSKAIAMAVVCAFLVNDSRAQNYLVYSNTPSKTATLAPESRFKPFIDTHVQGFRDFVTLSQITAELREFIHDRTARQGNIARLNAELHKKLHEDLLEINTSVVSGHLSTGKHREYAISVFHFKKTDKNIQVVFLKDYKDSTSLTGEEKKELADRFGIKNDRDYRFIDYPGLEGVWFVKPASLYEDTENTHFEISKIGLPVTSRAMKDIATLAGMRNIKYSKNVIDLFNLSHQADERGNKSVTIRWKHPVYEGETELTFDLGSGKMLHGERKIYGKTELIGADEVTSLLSGGMLMITLDSKKAGRIVYNILISLRNAPEIQKAELVVSRIVEYAGYGIITTNHATGKQALSRVIIPDDKKTLFVDSILNRAKDRDFIVVLGDALRNIGGDVYLTIKDGRPKLCASDSMFGYAETDIFFVYNRLANLLSDSAVQRFFMGKSRDAISDEEVTQLLYKHSNERICAKRTEYWEKLVTANSIVTIDREEKYIKDLISEASASEPDEVIHLHLHPPGAGLSYFICLGEKVHEPKYRHNLENSASIPSSNDIKSAAIRGTTYTRWSKIFGIVYWKYRERVDGSSIEAEEFPYVAFYYLPAFLANDNLGIKVAEFVEAGIGGPRPDNDMIEVLDTFFTEIDSARMVIRPVNQPTRLTGMIDLITSAQNEAKRTHDENMKIEYMPTIPDKTILCHIITDSILPAGQKNMLKTLEQDMRSEKYGEKVVSLSIPESTNPEAFMAKLDAIKAQIESQYQDYKVQFDVACPRQDLVEIIQKQGMRALAFAKEGEGDIIQVEGIILALRALKTGSITNLINVYKLLTGKDYTTNKIDINEVAKMMLFILPVRKVDVNKIGILNRIIEENIKTAA